MLANTALAPPPDSTIPKFSSCSGISSSIIVMVRHFCVSIGLKVMVVATWSGSIDSIV